MNIGRYIETVLGWAGLKLGKKICDPNFLTVLTIRSKLHAYTDEAGIPRFGHYLPFMMVEQVQRFDQTCIRFGVIYIEIGTIW